MRSIKEFGNSTSCEDRSPTSNTGALRASPRIALVYRALHWNARSGFRLQASGRSHEGRSFSFFLKPDAEARSLKPIFNFHPQPQLSADAQPVRSYRKHLRTAPLSFLQDDKRKPKR